MDSGSPGRPRTLFLILAWLLMVFGVGIMAVGFVIFKKRSVFEFVFTILLLAGITGILLRRFRPQSRLGRLLPGKIQGQNLEQRVSKADVLVAVVLVAILLVLAWIRLAKASGI